MRKKGKNSVVLSLMLCLLTWVAMGALYPAPAHAGVDVHDPFPTLIHPQNNEICPIEMYNANNLAEKAANRKKYGIIKRIVTCVQGVVIPATYSIMYSFATTYLYSTITIACVLAMLFWGYLMVVGRRSAPMREAFMVALKIGAVSFFTVYFTGSTGNVFGQSAIWPDGLFPVMIAITDDLARIVSEYIGYSTTMRCAVTIPAGDVWGRVDCALNTLFGGIFDPSTLIAGLVGFFFSCIFSGSIGLFIAIFGFVIIFFLIMAILRATYITITAYIGLALMSLISPIFITMILFKSTFGYFEKWLKLTMGFILQPMFLFAYLAMMLAAFDTVVYDGRFSIYRSLMGQQVLGAFPSPLPAYPSSNAANPEQEFLIGRKLFDLGVYNDAPAAPVGVGTDPKLDAHIAATQTGVGGDMGLKNVPDSLFGQKNAAGMGLSVLDSFASINVYKLEIPMKRISWKLLAAVYYNISDPSDDQVLNYIIQLLLSLLVALITIYIFYLMLDALPFIGAGLSGEKFSMPVLGKGGLAMPGNKLLDKMKDSLSKAKGGKT